MAKHIQWEAMEQEALFRWVGFYSATHPEVNLLYHIPNGGSRNQREAANLKRQGVRAGVPDLCLPVPRAGKHGLYIELKARDNKPTKEQTKWLQWLQGQGYAVAVCWGWQEAMNTIINYLGGRHDDNIREDSHLASGEDGYPGLDGGGTTQRYLPAGAGLHSDFGSGSGK